MMAYLVAIALLAGILVADFRVFGTARSPGVLFTAHWLFLTTVLLLTSGRFYPVPPKALLIFVTGAAAFSAGASAVWWLSGKNVDRVIHPPTDDDVYFRRVLQVGLAVLVISAPFYVRHTIDLARIGAGNGFFYSVRRGSVLIGDRPVADIHYTVGYVYLINLPVLALLLALFAMAECTDRRFLRPLAAGIVIVCAGYAVLTSSIGPVIQLAVGILGIVITQRRRVPPRALIAVAGSSLAGFCFMAIATRKIGSLISVLLLYLVGGLVAFGTAVQSPGSVPPNWSIWRFFLQTANKFGGRYPEPSLHLPYTEVGQQVLMNVYTMYFAYYPSYGWAGVVVLSGTVGAVSTLVFLRAFRGERPWQVAYGIVLASILMSGFTESFFMGLNLGVKMAVFLTAMYALPARLRRAGYLQRLRIRADWR